METSAIEIAVAAAKALSNSLPGFLLSKLPESVEKPLLEAVPFLKYFPALRLKQVEHALTVLKDRVRRIEVTPDGERLLGFANMCFRYFEAGSKEHREIKLSILAAACAHCAEVGNLDPFDVELEIFESIERLQPFHIAILHHLDKHHTVPSTDAGHQHPPTATYEELLDVSLGDAVEREVWLPKALLTLRDMSAIYVQGGSAVGATTRGRFAPIVDPNHVVQHGKIGLHRFGCRLLRYVKSALDDEGGHPTVRESSGTAISRVEP
jgi:hypothetical protein